VKRLTLGDDASILDPMSENLLGRETSPYLLQHADNPVHWRAWGPDALQAAGDQRKPILLSVGYAACHWCHVMAHESFEDQATAALMNDLFINIKVDREERPDLDTIYQHALMLLGQQGGWPLTMFLTPDGEPFWGGTYFPPADRYGRPGFPEVLQAISSFYRENPDKITEQVGQMRKALGGLAEARSGGEIPIELNDRAADRLVKEFDMVDGGIGGAPKFPNPSILELLWRAHKRNGAADTRAAVLLSLDKMSQGGIYDHLGGGYARYSTDAQWLAPHFEKMLYDNAQLMDLLVAAWRDTRNPLYATRVAETAEWVLREMIADGGAFAATLDADSEGEEGKFYVWTADEIGGALGDAAEMFKRVYDVTPIGNWEGKTILHRNHAGGALPDGEEATLAQSRSILLDLRAGRIRPGWDDKVLVDWNGLMIAAMANAGAVLERTDWIDAAIRAYDFVVRTMADNGRLWHVWRADQLQHKATLDGYANMARAALMLHEVTGDASYLGAAEGWAAVLDRHFWDAHGGGYFFTADDAEALIVRTKSAADHATPAGNGVAADVLARLYYLTGKEAYRERAEAVIAAFSGEASENLFPLATLLNASETLQRATQIVIVGERGTPDCAAMFRAAITAPAPSRLITVYPPGADLPDSHPAAGKGQHNGTATAYVCVGPECSLPLTNVAGLVERLS
jgi:uncharacterized protein YyaL (SSP411 family)